MKMNNQNGSVFFFILLGVALFAALSYAVTQSLRLTSDSEGTALGNSEKSTASIADIQQFLDALTIRVFHLTNSNGIPENMLDFKNNVYLLADDTAIVNNINASCVTDNCHVFSPYAPDGLMPFIFRNSADTPDQTNIALPKNGHGQVRQVILNGVGTGAPELMFLIHGISPRICNLYNQKQGVTTTYTSATTLTLIGEGSPSSTPDAFTGTFSTTNNFGLGATAFTGKKSFCAPAYIDGEDNRLAIWHVLKVR